MKTIDSKIRKAAKRARAWADRTAPKYGFERSLSCFCTIGARRLFTELKREKLKPMIAICEEPEDDCHAFVICDKYLVDVTASQFGKENIFIKKTNQKEPHPWEVHITFTSTRNFIKYLRRTNWPEEQIVLLPKFRAKKRGR